MTSPDYNGQRIRVSIVVQSDNIPTWIARIIRRISKSPFSEISHVFIEGSEIVTSNSQYKPVANFGLTNPRHNGHSLIFRCLVWFFNRFCQWRPEIEDVFRLESLHSILPEIPVSYLDNFINNEVQLSALRHRSHVSGLEFESDLIVNFGLHRIEPKISSLARYGVWTLEHADSIPVGFSNLLGFWESIEEIPSTSCVVRVYESSDRPPFDLTTTWASSITSSVEDNRRSIALHAVPLISRMIEKLHRDGAHCFFAEAKARNLHPAVYSAKPTIQLSSVTLTQIIWKRLIRRFSKAIGSVLWQEQWSLFICRNSGPNVSLGQFVRTTPPKDRFWADPYLLKYGEKHFVFFEEVLRSKGIGRIAVGEIGKNSKVTNVRVALSAKHHLSHPFVIKHDDEIYMIPESRASGCITLYRNVSMPDRWEKVSDLMTNVDASDVTVHFHDGLWWLFVNMADTAGASTSVELFLFFSPVFPSSSWEPHPMNPVVSDVRRARSAGRLFYINDRLYRPAQDCSLIYGWRFSINHVKQLDRLHYKESTIALAEPTWVSDIIRTHTFNQVDEIQVVDGMVRRPRWWKAE